MRLSIFLRAALLAGLALPGIAMADDPRDPTMQTPEAVARDREQIRQMNLDMLRQVRERDASYAQGWRDYKQFKQGTHPDQQAHRRDLAEYERDRADYAQNRRRYEQAMADWRKDVSACRAGNRNRCDGY